MTRKPLLPEVLAEREQAMADYRAEQKAAVDRIAGLREQRLARDATLAAAATPKPSRRRSATPA